MKPNLITSENIQTLGDNEVFVFGSNYAGRHGKGAALLAKKKFGAMQGVGVGRTGECYALPIKDARDGNFRESLPLDIIGDHIELFLAYAINRPHVRFWVTAVGCGLGGYTPEQIAPFFELVKTQPISNVSLPQSFWDALS